MTGTGWEFLTKKELLREAIIRDIQVDEGCTALTILSILMNSQLKEVNYELHVPKVTSISQELVNFQEARRSLKEYYDKVCESITIKKSRRLLSRLNHWLDRAKHLEKIIDLDNKSCVFEFQKFILEVKEKLSELSSQPVISHLSPVLETSLLDAAWPSQDNNNLCDMSASITHDNPTMPIPQSYSYSHPVVPMNTPVPTFSYEVAKLPNPIQEILKEGRHYNVEDYNAILFFLRTLVLLTREATRFKISDPEILSIIYPFCDGVLAEFVSNFMLGDVQISKFHTAFIQTYLPITILSRFITQFVLRPQAPQEPFHFYIQQVRLHAEMFKVNYTEQQIVEMIISNSTKPEIRSLFLNASPPKTIDELMVVANKLSHCESADLLRAKLPDPQFWNNSRITGSPTSSSPNQNKRTPVCFYCGITGHVIGVCKKRKRDQATNNSQ